MRHCLVSTGRKYMERLEEYLIQTGLNEKEAKIYLASLELGPASIQTISKKSGIKRGTVYEILKNLKRLGLFTETLKGKRKLIVPAEPENLKRNIKEKERKLAEILPELKAISNSSLTKPKISFYEGREGIKEIYFDALKNKNINTYGISPAKTIVENVGEDFFNSYIDERIKRKIWIKLIHITSRDASYKYSGPETYEKALKKVRFTPQEIDIPNTFIIYKNKTAVISSRKEGFGFIIESEDFTKSMKIFHNLLWQISKPYEEIFGPNPA